MAGGSPSREEEKKREVLSYHEVVEKLSRLGIPIELDREHYSRAYRDIKMLIAALLEHMEAEEEKKGIELTEDEVEYIIYRLRTVYGDSMATRIVSKLFDALRRLKA